MTNFGVLRKGWTLEPQSFDMSVYARLKVAIFGGTGGLGRAMAQALLAKNAQVTVVGKVLKDAPHPLRSFVRADLSSLRNARSVARDIVAETFDAVLLTHGIFAGGIREETSEGLEKDLATSALSRWEIVRELAPRLGRERPANQSKPRLFVLGFPGGERSLDFTDVE